MSNRLKLPFALVIAALLLGGCSPFPGDIPPLASAVTAGHTVTT
ncbi:hypothetical protein N8H71_16885 [Pseudomonas koreensis]|nr:hypothetical protein [Pseudomonas koreensis]MCU0073271.1 hypothetical protein [Pseudomonas koreensis]